MPLTETQRSVVEHLRTLYKQLPSQSFGRTESVEQRARLPLPQALPTDVTVRVEIAPPSPHPHHILQSTGALRAPERVPVYFYALRARTDGVGSNLDPGQPDVNSDDAQDIENSRVIFFIHGGGNVTGHPTLEQYLQYYVQLLRTTASHSGGATKCVLVSPSYRLATVPENAFPAALQDLVAAYDYIVGKGYKASNIVITGDSAGGNHAVVLTHLILQSSKASPHGVCAIAPGSIQTHEFLSDYAKTLIGRDMLDVDVNEELIDAYVGDSGVARTDPLVSGAFIPFTTSWPKTLILIGNGDLLIDASRELEKRLSASQRPVELVEYDGLPHGWWVMPQVFAEDVLDSAERIARFVLH